MIRSTMRSGHLLYVLSLRFQALFHLTEARRPSTAAVFTSSLNSTQCNLYTFYFFFSFSIPLYLSLFILLISFASHCYIIYFVCLTPFLSHQSADALTLGHMKSLSYPLLFLIALLIFRAK